MQIASRQPMWNEGGRGTVIEVNMTPTTGLYIKFVYGATAGKPFVIKWGDGTKTERPYTSGEPTVEHTYPAYGKYKIVAEGCCNIVFRVLDGHPQYSYDAAITSFVDSYGNNCQWPIALRFCHPLSSRFQFIVAFPPLSLGSKEANDVSLLFAIRSLRRACTV